MATASASDGDGAWAALRQLYRAAYAESAMWSPTEDLTRELLETEFNHARPCSGEQLSWDQVSRLGLSFTARVRETGLDGMTEQTWNRIVSEFMEAVAQSIDT